jgi:acyl carrier protein
MPEVKPLIFEKICELISEQFSVDEKEITMSTSFKEDLGADSLDIVELIMALEEEFDLSELGDEDLEKLQTVGDAVNFISSKVSDL